MSLDRFEAELRAAAPADAPGAERKARSRALVMAAAGLAASPPPVPTSLASKGGALATKLGLLGALAVGLGIAGVLATRSSPPPAPPSAAPTATASAVVVAHSAEPPLRAPESAPRPIANASPLPTPPPVASPASAAPSASVASAPDPLSVEAALLESARACLNRQESPCAAAKLSDYDKRFPHGALADEATLLHIEAARANGDRPEARRYAERLLAAHPSGPYAKRAKAILAELGD